MPRRLSVRLLWHRRRRRRRFRKLVGELDHLVKLCSDVRASGTRPADAIDRVIARRARLVEVFFSLYLRYLEDLRYHQRSRALLQFLLSFLGSFSPYRY